jgi:hypothetical protein
LPNISKYCVCRLPGASFSAKEYAMLMPSIGFCGTPFTSRGSGIPATSRIVGAMSMMWWNCERKPPLSMMRLGHEMTRPLRVI